MDTRTSLALGNNAVVSAELPDLMSDTGVPLSLDKGEQYAVVVLPVPTCSIRASATPPPPSPAAWNTAEHVITVAGLKLTTESGPFPADILRLALGSDPNFQLSYGEVIALGGDFYGDPNNPVCMAGDPVGQFRNNFKSLATSQPQVVRIMQVANKFEFAPIARSVGIHWQPSAVYAGLAVTPGGQLYSPIDQAYSDATGGTYMALAKTNFDHFGVDAITCYRAGHQLAQQQAVTAAQSSDATARKTGLEVAYAMNAFADHFLTDLFAAGHMRTPRHALYDSGSNPLTKDGGSVCAKQMHDEDNKFGLWVDNAVGDTWVAYGDGRYRDSWNAAGRVVMKKAIQQSMNEVWLAFKTGNVDNNAPEVLKFTAAIITEITEVETSTRHRDDPRNWAPLFWQDPSNGNILRRNALYDPSDRTYCEQGLGFSTWGISTTVVQLKKDGFPVYMPQPVYAHVGVRFPPDETGPTGEYGWPAQPNTMTGPYGATGPSIRGTTGWSWSIDGSAANTGTGPTG
jgi:hypothetical protein